VLHLGKAPKDLKLGNANRTWVGKIALTLTSDARLANGFVTGSGAPGVVMTPH
jgi:hypothetical protein